MKAQGTIVDTSLTTALDRPAAAWLTDNAMTCYLLPESYSIHLLTPHDRIPHHGTLAEIAEPGEAEALNKMPTPLLLGVDPPAALVSPALDAHHGRVPEPSPMV